MFPENSPQRPQNRTEPSQSEKVEWQKVSYPQSSEFQLRAHIAASIGRLAEDLGLPQVSSVSLTKAVDNCLDCSLAAGARLAEGMRHLRGLDMHERQAALSDLTNFYGRFRQIPDAVAHRTVETFSNLLAESCSPQIFLLTTEVMGGMFRAIARTLDVQQTISRMFPPVDLSESAALRQHAQILILGRAINDSWRTHYLEEILATFRSPSHTNEGFLCRLDLLQNNRHKNAPLRLSLGAVTSLEVRCERYKLSAEQRSKLFDADKVMDIVSCLNRHQAGSGASSLEPLLLDVLGDPASPRMHKPVFFHLMRHLSTMKEDAAAEYLGLLQDSLRRGCSLDFACIVHDALDPMVADIKILADMAAPTGMGSRDSTLLVNQSFSAFLERYFEAGNGLNYSEARNTLYTLVRGFDFDGKYFSPIELDDTASIGKYLLCLRGAGLKQRDAISSLNSAMDVLIQLIAHRDIENIMAHPQSIDLQERFNIIYYTDNPPFSLETTPDAEQREFTSQVWSMFNRSRDAHHGFWSNTYQFRHTPLGGRCPFDELMHGWNAENYLIPCADIGKFPGRGRFTKNIDVTNIFNDSLEMHEWERTFAAYGPVPNATRAGNVHAIYNLPRAQIHHLRTFDAFSVPSNNFFKFEDVLLSLITWNHHSDATGTARLTLVPTVVLDRVFAEYLVPLEEAQRSGGAALRDISQEAPTRARFLELCLEMDLGILPIDLTSPSNFTGGFCNGFPLGSERFHYWETSMQAEDAFGRSHKWSIKSHTDILKRLREAHQQLFEIGTAYLNLRDLFRLTVGLDARSYIPRYFAPSYQGTPWHEQQHEIQFGREQLKLFCEFASECREIGRPSQAPVLVIAPMKYSAPQPRTPIVLDGTTGFGFYEGGKPFDLEIEAGIPSPRLVDWWQNYVDEHLARSENFWYAPRLVARENYLDRMKDYGYRQQG